MGRKRLRSRLAEAAVKGALAGMAGGVAMKAALKAEKRLLLPEGESYEAPPREIVEKVEKSTGVQLSREQEEAAAMGVHMGYSAFWGAVHGVGQDLMHLPVALHGVLLGALVYGTSMGPSGLLTRLGITSSPMTQPMARAAIPVGAHLAYGLTTAATYHALA